MYTLHPSIYMHIYKKIKLAILWLFTRGRIIVLIVRHFSLLDHEPLICDMKTCKSGRAFPAGLRLSGWPGSHLLPPPNYSNADGWCGLCRCRFLLGTKQATNTPLRSWACTCTLTHTTCIFPRMHRTGKKNKAISISKVPAM